MLLALSTHCSGKGGKVEGEAEILKNEETCLRLQGRSVAQAGPKELSERWQGPWPKRSSWMRYKQSQACVSGPGWVPYFDSTFEIAFNSWPSPCALVTLREQGGYAAKGSTGCGGRQRHKMLEKSTAVSCHQQNPKFQPSHTWASQTINSREEHCVTLWWAGTGTSHRQDDFRQVAPTGRECLPCNIPL